MKLLLLFFLFNFGIFCYGFNQNRIIDGVAVPVGEYQNVVRIHPMSINYTHQYMHIWKNDSFEFDPTVSLFTCTGTLISKRHILTAAHCVTDSLYFSQMNEMIVLDGFFIDYRPVDEFSRDEFDIKNFGFADLVAFFPGWKFELYANDIAIILLPTEINDIEPVLLAKNFIEGENDMGVNVGYGDMDIDMDIENISKTLLKIDIPILPFEECIQSNVYSVMCAGTSEKRSDHGDSGGPLFFNASDGKEYQIGIANGMALKSGNFPLPWDVPDYVAYIRISAYCIWIEQTTKGEAKCVEIGGMSTSNQNPQVPENGDEPDVPPNTNKLNDTTAKAQIAGITEVQKSDENNGAVSKNCILLTLFFSFILNFFELVF